MCFREKKTRLKFDEGRFHSSKNLFAVPKLLGNPKINFELKYNQVLACGRRFDMLIKRITTAIGSHKI